MFDVMDIDVSEIVQLPDPLPLDQLYDLDRGPDQLTVVGITAA